MPIKFSLQVTSWSRVIDCWYSNPVNVNIYKLIFEIVVSQTLRTAINAGNVAAVGWSWRVCDWSSSIPDKDSKYSFSSEVKLLKINQSESLKSLFRKLHLESHRSILLYRSIGGMNMYQNSICECLQYYKRFWPAITCSL